MLAIRPTLSAARRLLPGRLVVLLPLLLTILAACGLGRGGGPAY
jgi:hypothetical protein